MLDRHFAIFTDHQVLKWLLPINYPTRKIARWSLKLQQHDFIVRYKPETQHGNEEASSRRLYGSTTAITLPNKDVMRFLYFNKKNQNWQILIVVSSQLAKRIVKNFLKWNITSIQMVKGFFITQCLQTREKEHNWLCLTIYEVN